MELNSQARMQCSRTSSSFSPGSRTVSFFRRRGSTQGTGFYPMTVSVLAASARCRMTLWKGLEHDHAA
jgi:hypothetical protein